MSPALDNDRRYIHLVIGITGHRDILDADKDILKNKIKDIFNELKKKYPNTPLLLLTPLAEGADRIAAMAAIEMNIKYIVPLPLPCDEYINDFPGTKDEFDDLLNNKNSLGHFVVSPMDESELKQCRTDPHARDKKYESVGIFVAKHCQILIALWDGVTYNNLIGGTSNIYNYKHNGILPEYAPNRNILDIPDTGPVYHIHTRRKSNKNIENIFQLDKIYPYGKTEETFCGKNGIFTKMERFNIMINELTANEIEESRKDLASQKLLDKEKFISYIYGAADSLSMKMKKKWLNLQIFLLGLVVILFGVFVAYEFFNLLYILIAYLLAYVSFAALFKMKNLSHSYHQYFVEYRSLAEGLRVQFFLRLSGLHEDHADPYLRKHRDHLQWIREVMRSANLFDPQSEPNLCDIKEGWICKQYEYYRNTADKNNKLSRKLEKLQNTFFLLGIISILIAIILKVAHIYNILLVSTVLITFFPFLAGLIEVYISRSTVEITGEEYKRMEKILEKANCEWNKAKKDSTKVEIIKEVAKEILRENGDWLLLHHHVSDKIPL